ncbi:hypothetical protein QEH52_17535 [Coraliomargarita sp. SDUM461003]|uniref:Outer membrane chaperone Skp n=1 Tax=Thalassobacterium maritimum TaxID=3041265 RepID=A0ABU1B122_9BACT|nr:hypothetical protein [Coraliomargarita sp. SDUM461003]MDQ8209334.1 hypothetical protein [Coraliomargarita sp. SDUM461003]
MKIKSIMIQLLICLLMLSSASAESTKASVAKVDYNEIDDLLVQVVLNMAGNEELGERFYAKKEAAKAAQEKMQSAMMRGEAFDPRAAAAGMMHDDSDQKKVDQLCQKHLLELIERVFEDRYEIIFKDEYRSSLLFTRGAIDDVTMTVKQELLKALPSN